MNLPSCDLVNGDFILTEAFTFETGIVTGTVGTMCNVVLSDTGRLSICPGFRWNGGSGPAVDTPSMLTASLAHDCLYALMYVGELNKKHKVSADKYFRQVLKEYGVSWFRRNYCYLAVRIFGSV